MAAEDLAHPPGRDVLVYLVDSAELDAWPDSLVRDDTRLVVRRHDQARTIGRMADPVRGTRSGNGSALIGIVMLLLGSPTGLSNGRSPNISWISLEDFYLAGQLPNASTNAKCGALPSLQVRSHHLPGDHDASTPAIILDRR